MNSPYEKAFFMGLCLSTPIRMRLYEHSSHFPALTTSVTQRFPFANRA